MQISLCEELHKEQTNKRKISADLDDRFVDRKSAIKRFKSDDKDDTDSDEDVTESQEELLGEYVETENAIADVQAQIVSVKKQMNRYL